MKGRKKRFVSLFLAFSMILTMAIPGSVWADEKNEDIVILYTNDVHTYIDGELSYDVLAGMKDKLETEYKHVLLVDAGDHIQGTAYGSMDKGKTIIDLMNAAGYDLATLGNHEFDYGMEGRINVTDYWAGFPYISCNFYHEAGGVVGDTVFDASKTYEGLGKWDVKFVGITTPETFTKSTPAYFQDADGNYIFNAVPTSDWGSPETLEYWRKQWAAMCNAKFEEKGLPERIDHRSYERQGVDILPTIHEGPSVRQMEAKGIRTDKGEFNRWIKATNGLIQSIRKKIAVLLDWLKETKEELSKPQTPDLISLLQIYFNQRNAGAYTQKAKANNLKELSEIITFLQEHGITDVESLEAFISERRSIVDEKKTQLDIQTTEMKDLQKLPDAWDTYKRLKPVADKVLSIKFTKAKEKYKAEHKAELNQFYAANRLLTKYFPDGKYNSKAIQARYAELEQQHDADYTAFKDLREETQVLWKIKSHIDAARKELVHTQEHQQKKQGQEI